MTPEELARAVLAEFGVSGDWADQWIADYSAGVIIRQANKWRHLRDPSGANWTTLRSACSTSAKWMRAALTSLPAGRREEFERRMGSMLFRRCWLKLPRGGVSVLVVDETYDHDDKPCLLVDMDRSLKPVSLSDFVKSGFSTF